MGGALDDTLLLEPRPNPLHDFSWFPDWTGQTAVIVGSGPSARDVDLNVARDRGCKVIVINESVQLAPWADVLYGCDHQWWYRRRTLAAKFQGLKISQDRFCEDFTPELDIKRIHAVRGPEHMRLDNPGWIAWGGNSGFQTLNLCTQWNPKKIILVGFDMTLVNGDHWHGHHGHGLSNPKEHNVRRWRRVTDNAYAELTKRGIAGFNTSMKSALLAWPKVSLQEALDA